MIAGVLPLLAVPMPTAPYPIPQFVLPKSRTESGIRYLSYASLLFAASAAVGIALSFVLFPLLASALTMAPGRSPDPALFGSLFALAGAACAGALVSLMAGILGLIGLYNVHEGGDEFGPEHARRVQRGLIVAIVGVIVPSVGATAVGGFMATSSSALPGSGFLPTFNPVTILIQLAFGLVQVILLGLFLSWTVERLATPLGLARATWAFVIGIVGVGATSIGALMVLILLPIPTRPEQVTPWLFAPSAIGQGVSIASLLAWYLAYRDVLERFRRRELIARPPAIYLPAPPYYPGYYPAPAVAPASPSPAQGPPPEGPPEKPPPS